MKKNVQINIAIDDVEMKSLDTIQEELEAIFAAYPDKRITMILQDEPLVNFRS